jgi:cell surface protein SprA
LKLIKKRTPLPSRDPQHTWSLEWKNVYRLGGSDIPIEGFQVKIFFKSPAGNHEEYLTEPGRAPLSYLRILGLDERADSGVFVPDNLIDLDPAILDLQRGELIFPELRPFAPAGIFLGESMSQILLPRDKYAAAMYDTSSISAINTDSKFFIEVRYQGSH